MNKLLRWFRSLSLFDWHNKQIQYWIQAYKFLEEQDTIIINREREMVAILDDRLRLLQTRMDEWIARSEGSRYKQLYDELKNKPHYLEAHANRQAKIINWIQAHTSTIYPGLVDKAREKTSG